MTLAPMVPNPFPKPTWRHVCSRCGTTMVENIDNHGIHCPTCHPKAYDAQLRLSDAS